MRLRCVTINLKGLQSGWFEERAEVLVAGMKPYDPDVVALQETAVLHGSDRRNEAFVYNQARAIADGLGLEATAFTSYGNPVEVMSPEQGGIALLSRWPLRSVRNRKLPHGSGSPPDSRTALQATVSSPDGPLDVVTTHLSWRPGEAEVRLVQMGLILETFSGGRWEEETARTVFLGDLNAGEDEPAILLAAERLKDAYRAVHPGEDGFTWSVKNPLTGGFAPDRRLDYIFCPRAATVLRAEVILNEPRPVYASDHFGVFAEIEWP